MMAGVLFGLAAAVALSAWQNTVALVEEAADFRMRSLLAQATPLTLAFFGFQILFTADTLLVKTYFSDADADFYVSAGTLSPPDVARPCPLRRSCFHVWFHSAAKAEKTNLMGLVCFGRRSSPWSGRCLSLLGPFVVKVVYKQAYVQVASAILPWYACAMIPLALAKRVAE